MFTGEGNPYNLSKISLVNGKNTLNMWGGKTPEEQNNQCNIVKGSDGSTFNPYIKKVCIIHISQHLLHSILIEKYFSDKIVKMIINFDLLL